MSDIKNNSLGRNLKKLREEKGLPLRIVAAEIDLDPSTLGKFEKNTRNPNPVILQKLSQFYGVDFDELRVTALSDRLAKELGNDKMKFEIIKATEEKLKNY